VDVRNVVYHDYGPFDCVGVTRYVEEESFQRDGVLLHDLNGHAVIIKLK